MLGLAPVALAVAKLPEVAPKVKSRVLRFWHGTDCVDEILLQENGRIVAWRPTTVYNTGDKVMMSNGDKYRVLYAGISGSTEPLQRESFMDYCPQRNPGDMPGTLGLKKA